MNKAQDQVMQSANLTLYQSLAPSHPPMPELSRRDFLKSVSTTGALVAATSLGFAGALLTPTAVEANELECLNSSQRRVKAFLLRQNAALIHLHEKVGPQRNNGDEKRYPDRRANFSKGLPHNNLGEVDSGAYFRLLNALASGEPADFEAIPLGGTAKLTNPQAAFAFDMLGVDSQATSMPPAPMLASAEAAAEIGEIYWMALARDIPYQNYEADLLVADAVADLNAFSVIVGPTEGGQVTPNTLFRSDTPGDLTGPYVSQFLWHDVPYGASTIVQQYRTPVADINFMTDYAEWLAIQRGAKPSAALTLDLTPRYIHTMRALGGYVQKDVVFQPFFNAAMIIMSFGAEALDPANPYLKSNNQGGFVTFGPVHICDLVTKAARVALEGAWFHKWLVHRRLRPEAFGGRIENQNNGSKNYGIHPDILDSAAVARTVAQYRTALLPQAYPEGSPLHSSYPAGHATLSGACATVLKAFFNEDFVIPKPVVASADGLRLEPWTDVALTLGGEIDKLASNVSVGRCAAGIHYRFDGRGMQVGETQAIGILQDYSKTYNEEFDGFTLTRFDGQKIRIVNGKVRPA